MKDKPIDVNILTIFVLLNEVFYIIFALSIQLTITITTIIPVELGLLNIFGLFGVYIMLLLAVLCFITAIGLYIEHEWGWIFALVIFVFGIFNFWIGTIVNLLFIVYMFQNRVKNIYNIEW